MENVSLLIETHIRGVIMNLEELVVSNIKKYRKIKHISQEKLAEKCDTSTSYIGLMEIGKNVPKLSTIERIAKALEIEPHLLFVTSEQDFTEGKKQVILKEMKKILDEHI